MMEILSNILIHGLANGGMSAILAVGFALIFGVAKIVNMAHTAFYMVASFFIYIAISNLGLPVWMASMIAITTTAAVSVICYKLVFDRVKHHETALMIISVALAILFQEIFLMIYGGHYRSIPAFVSGFMDIGVARVSLKHLFAAAISGLTLVVLWVLLSHTRLGNAIRAVAQDREIANLVGIDVSRICMITMAISAALAGVAGAIVAPIYMVHPLMWMQPLVMVLAAVVLGGLGSIKGAVIAAVILGLAESAVVFLIPDGSFLSGAASLAVMVIVLIFMPEGLYGVVFEEERL